MRLKDIVGSPSDTPQGVAVRMPSVVQATRFALIAYVVGLIAVGTSVTLHGSSQTMEQYNATAAFIFSWNAFRFGVWKNERGEPRWLRTACIDSGKAFCILVALAVIGNILNSLKASAGPH
jgi:hypothetical protein